ncbi:MAG: hypothetical protein EA426_03700 [Spirochaetaceae bacterium]|nr:MAG: hypothetical protein EA426_03700 [Spirochaetaceae bacterium]
MYAIVRLIRFRAAQDPPQRATVWALAFGFLTVAGLLGFVAHGFVLSPETLRFLWQPLFLCLGLTISMFAVGVIIDLKESSVSPAVIVASAVIAVLFYATTHLFSGDFLVFIVYEAFVMLFAIVAYLIILVKRRESYARWMLAGIVVTLIAAVIQATGTASITIIWEFDHNGIFHLVQILGILLILTGLSPRNVVKIRI